MKIIYFSWVRDKTGVGSEELNPPASVTTVESLIDWLKEQGAGHAQAFADVSVIRAAVNQEHVKLQHPVGPDDEVAFFPPVTGG
ncbi:MAG: molybdopterin converting factor subunit 1 [Rhodospirillaceae bacterium]|nr:molybdopterin converting factor subunit 1 [Rhodospirillaceae bacterium]MBT5243578.1 molybdopterin converting factor subunit 1 [Rhodospirillaceae bacterium]MBT5562166.1 molybdopterin converting factor subunit 1 [Rhodospirillaceae bacterium]MBT6242339.1 molybdopterin converting factor subunit 1 [Rhodospirillaceae bacterium]MBT7138955.1 molybdopterin converting factor subunit 1 [Rhodospirillaceae bacterium]